MSSFNPYREWLGIPDGAATPNHYRLLGLRLFEDSPAAISTAATRLGGIVCQHLSGPYVNEARHLLKELETARHCLLNPSTRAQYDAALRQQLSASPPNPVAQEAINPHLPPAAVSWRGAASSTPLPPGQAPVMPPQAAPAAAPAPYSQASTPAGAPLPPVPPGAVPVTAPAGGVHVPNSVTASPYAAMPLPPGSYASGSPGAASYAPPAAPGYPPAAPTNYPPPASPASFATPAAIPLAASPAPLAPMAIPVAAPAAPMYATPVYAGAVPAAQRTAAYEAPSAEPVLIAPRSRLSWRRREAPSPAVLLACVTGVLVLAAVIVVVARRPDLIARSNGTDPDGAGQLPEAPVARPPRDAERVPSRPADRPASIDADGNATNNRPPPPAIVVPPAPAPASSPLTPAPAPTPDPAKDEAVTKALNAARVALSQTDTAAATAHIAAARQVGAPNRAEEIERVEALAAYTEDFSKAVREGTKGLEIGGQFAVKESFVGVVEVQSETIVLRVQGQNKTYEIKSLPPAIAYALAESWLRKDDAVTNMVLGTYHAMQPRGDRTKARELWQAAARSGARAAAEQLLPELDVPLPVPADVMPAVADAEKPGADGRFRLPGATDQSQARSEVRQMFEADYAESKDVAAKGELAAKLLQRAIAPGDTPAVRYILLLEAGKLAAEAGDFLRMAAALDKLGEQYPVDTMALKADTLFEASKTTEGKEANQALASAALGICDEAVLSDSIDAALKIARTALAAARKSGDAELVKQCQAREKEVRDLK
jgi:hypothetical protein